MDNKNHTLALTTFTISVGNKFPSGYQKIKFGNRKSVEFSSWFRLSRVTKA